MTKRGLLLVFVMLLSVTLMACRGVVQLDDDAINQNIPAMEWFPPNVVEEVNVNDLSPYTVVTELLQVGLLVVENDQGHRGVYSTAHAGLVVPLAANMNYTLRFDPVFRGYIDAYNVLEDTLTVYDVNGDIVIAEGDYQTATVQGRTEVETDAFGNVISREYFETITTLTTEDFDNGITEATVVYTRVDIVEGGRTVIDPPTTVYEHGDQFESVRYPAMDLTPFGLTDHEGKLIGDVFYVYNPDGELLSTIPIPVGGTVTMAVIVDGHMLYQTMTQLPDTADDYDVISGGSKFLLRTANVDLRTGEESVIDFDYVVLSSVSFFNEDGVATHERVRVHAVESRLRIQHTVKEIVIDRNGNVVLDLSGMSFSTLWRLDDETIYNADTRILFDNDLNPVLERLNGTTLVLHERVMIVPHEGLQGVIDYRGTVLVPFIFDWLSDQFYNGTAYGLHENGRWVGTNLEGDIVEFDEEIVLITPGVLVTFDLTPDPDSGLFHARIVNYMDEIYDTMDLANVNNFGNLNNSPFHNEVIVRFNGENGPLYVSVLMSDPE